jgi:hypothetical protein
MIDILTAGGEIISENSDPSDLYGLGMDYDKICGIIDGLADSDTDEIEYTVGTETYVISLNERFLYDLGVSTAVEPGRRTFNEIGTLLGITESTAARVLKRAIKKLQLLDNDWTEITIKERITIYE